MKKQLTVIFVDLGGSLNKDFFDCEIVEELKEESDKEYKFIILCEAYIESLNNYDKLNELKQKNNLRLY